jgi:Ca-activated chloride channel family protein
MQNLASRVWLQKSSWQRRALLGMVLVLLMTCQALATVTRQAASTPERSNGAENTLSPYFVVQSDDPQTDALPLKDTRADVKIAGSVAAITITQLYKNQGKKTLEALYVFPASTRAAVHALRMTIGERVIEAEIMERQQARQTYETAKQQGQTASLLEQQRPNVFQMNVANILPGDEIKVELKYVELLDAEDQVYEFVFPTVVGPRYSNMSAAGAPDTEKWVQNPYLHQGQAPPYTFGLKVDLDSGLPISKLACPSHDVNIEYVGKTQAHITLKDEKTGGNRDFVLRYALAGNKIQSGLLLHPGPKENFFLLMLEPPARLEPKEVVPREFIFIVDVSGSMHGFPLDTSKALMQDVISSLKSADFMNVLLFAGGSQVLSESGSLPATADNKQKASAFIKSQTGGGGTEILPALKRALALPRTEGVSRIVAVLTDGYVHVEPEVFETIRQNLGEANLFAFGIGTSVNRHLIDGMAKAGLGEPFVVLNPEEAAKQAVRFRQYIASPVLTNIKVAFPGFDAYDTEPSALPDLFALRPLAIVGKYRGEPAGSIMVTGKTATGDFSQTVKVAEGRTAAGDSALRLLWARKRIERLADLGGLPQGDPRIKEVTGLGLEYSLMTAYTSFVAVDKVKRADGKVVTVKQPLPLPEGVSDLAVGGRMLQKARMPYPAALAGSYAARTSTDAAREAAAPPPPEQEPKAKPVIRIQVTEVKGALTKDEVQAALETAAAKLGACCRQAQEQGVSLPKEITLKFTVGPDGKVASRPVVSMPVKYPKLWQCLTEVVKGIVFPASGKGPAQVTAKLLLETGQASK